MVGSLLGRLEWCVYVCQPSLKLNCNGDDIRCIGIMGGVVHLSRRESGFRFSGEVHWKGSI